METFNFIVLVAGILATPILALSYLPQIIQIAKTKSVDGISLSFWLILDASLLCFVILALDGFIKTGATMLLIAQGLNLALALTVTFQVLAYRHKGTN